MDHTAVVPEPILSPGIRTFKPRRSRITPRQARALEDAGPQLLTESSLAQAWDPGDPIILDIGFGSADPVIELASMFPDTKVLAVDVHTPGIGDLVDRCRTDNVTNVFIIEADILELVSQFPGTVAGVRSFFPDPWPKARHHKRRLVQPGVLDAMAKVVEPTGFWHLATDWAEYAESMQATFALNENWEGGVIERPSWRPVTHFEKRAIREDRPIVDMWFTRI
jgi:tRNA (guanine-N7-)-methyltransferase